MSIPAYDKKLTPKQRMKMRVDIAKDVLKMIEAGRISPSHWTYLTPQNHEQFDAPAGARAQLRTRLKSCNVCALGALFVSEVVKNDKLTVRDWAAADDEFGCDTQGLMHLRLAPFFDEEELRSIEEQFESKSFNGVTFSLDDIKYEKHASDALVTIMKHIVANKGEWTTKGIKFKPMRGSQAKFGPEYIGRRFGKLVALSRAPADSSKRGLWFFLCDCGKQITRSLSQVREAKVQSCGGSGCKHVNRLFVTHHGWAGPK